MSLWKSVLSRQKPQRSAYYLLLYGSYGFGFFLVLGAGNCGKTRIASTVLISPFLGGGGLDDLGVSLLVRH